MPGNEASEAMVAAAISNEFHSSDLNTPDAIRPDCASEASRLSPEIVEIVQRGWAERPQVPNHKVVEFPVW